MYGLLLTLLILDGILLMVIILLQAGKGGGLAAMGGGGGAMGTDNLIGGRQAATILTKSTWIAGGVFLFLSLVLSIVSTSARGTPESILQQEFQQQGAPAQPQPVIPGGEPQEPTGGEGAGAGETPEGLEILPEGEQP